MSTQGKALGSGSRSKEWLRDELCPGVEACPMMNIGLLG